MVYVLQKLGRALFVIWAAFTATFILLYLLPTNPIELLANASDPNSIPAEVIAELTRQYGFDQPPLVQYLQRLGAALTGDFGTSVRTGRPVLEAIAAVLPNTISLAATALVIALAISFGLAYLGTFTRTKWLGNLISGYPSTVASVPAFLLGLVIIHLFSFQLGWFPPLGDEGVRTLVLPAVTLAIPVSASITQLLLRNFRTEFAAAHVTTSFAKGGSRSWVIRHEVVRAASLPSITIAGLTFGALLGGVVLTETIFSRAGLGRLAEEAVRNQDVPVVQGITVLAATVFAVTNFAVDVLYPLIDPRLRAKAQTV